MNDELPTGNGGEAAAGSAVGRRSSFSFLNSIRWRLQIWYGLILVAVLTGFGVTAFRLEQGPVYRHVDGELQRRAGGLAQLLRQPPRNRGPQGPPDGQRPFDGPPDNQGFQWGPPRGRDFGGDPQVQREFRLPPEMVRLFDEADASGYYFVIWRRDGTELARSTNSPAIERSLPLPRVRQQTVNSISGQPDVSIEGPPGSRPGPPLPQAPVMRGIYREISMQMGSGDRILVGRSVATELSDMHGIAWMLSAVGAGILLLGMVGGWWLASRAIRPIEDISGTAAKISAGDLSQRIDVAETESELGRLAGVLNSTFARLEAAFAHQRQFTSDAAHELRTPVTVMLTQTQTTLNRERSAAEYRETIESCQRAAQRMRRMIESLLELARFDAGQQPMKQARFDLAQTAREGVAAVEPLAAARHVTITSELPALPCAGDSERLGQVITNLLTNAITYNREGGTVRLDGEAKDGTVILRVSDSGVGISAEDLPRVFDRFYRVDNSRTSGNTGLGLAITKAIVQAHGGAIEVSSQLGVGTVFTVRLPGGR